MSRRLKGTTDVGAAPSVCRLRDVFECRDGGLYWIKPTSSRAKVGQRAGTVRPDGYEVVGIDGCQLLVHRVVWAIANGSWPPALIDHINHRKRDNRPENLRVASDSQSSAHTRASRNNMLGVKGVYMSPKGRFVAQMGVKGKKWSLGTFDTLEEAKEAFARKAREVHGEFAST